MKLTMLPVLGIMLALPAMAQAPSFVGTWNLQFSIVGNDASDTCTFTVDTRTLKGSCGQFGPVVGTVDQTTANWKLEANGTELVFDGVLKDGEISGKVNVPAYGVDGTFVAKSSK